MYTMTTARRLHPLLFALLIAMAVLPAACASSRQMSAEFSAAAPMDMAEEAEEAAAGVPLENGVQRKIIGKAWLELVVDDVDATVQSIGAMMDELGGYVSAANLYKSQYDGSDAMQGSLTLRVPAGDLDTAVSRLEGVAIDVRSKSIDREDVTDQYSDIEAQLRNLEATENELRELLAEVRAKPDATAEDILAVHHNLTEIRRQIEQLQGRKGMMDNLIGMSTIEVTLIPDAVNRPVVEEGWRPGVVVRNATRALVNTMQLLGDIIIWFAVFVLPLLLLALIPLVVVIWLIRWVIRRIDRRSKQEAVAEPTEK